MFVLHTRDIGSSPVNSKNTLLKIFPRNSAVECALDKRNVDSSNLSGERFF